MNKIYKVVWNTVRNCYVVGSELISSKSGRHSTSNGKSSSLKVTLTVLALCGMTALGSGVVPAYAADAGTAVESQYVAVLVNKENNSSRNTRTFDGYRYHKETVSDQSYWVRDGYTIKYEENERYPGALKDNIIKAYKNHSYTASSDAGLLKSNQIMVESAGVSTLTGVNLDDVSGGTYVGATNSGSTSTPSSFNYMIKDDNGTYVDAGKTNFSKRFKAATKNTDGTYSYKGEVIANDNLYVVDNTVGVFLTSGGKVYTGKVFGANNEVLMTTKSDSGTMYSYWGADTPDPNTKLADMTIGQFNQALEKVNNNSKAVAGDTIKEIKTTAKTDGGTIDLVRRGQYNSATGQYEGEHKVGNGITITSRGGTNGEDVKINFSNGTTEFDVAAGSKVEAVGTKEATTGLTINGETYNIKTGQNYTAGDNITITGTKISAKNNYVNGGSVNKYDELVLTREGLEDLTVDLSRLTRGLSSTDYQLVANKNSSDGKYTVRNGEVTLTVKDMNNLSNKEVKTITISGLAGQEDLTHYFSVDAPMTNPLDPLGNYNNEGAQGNRSIAIGVKASATGDFSVAIGSGQNTDGAKASGDYATAVGNGSLAEGKDSTALGYNAAALGEDSVAIGYTSIANGKNSMALGVEARAGNNGAQADYATAVGALAHVDAGDGTALGQNAEVDSERGTALGSTSKVHAAKGTAIGAYTSVTAEGGVAIGQESVANRAAGMKGYAPVGEAGTSPVWKATDGAVSLGSDSSARTRQITNLAAGTENTDAVNVAQLKRARVELTNGTNTTVKSTNDQTDGYVIYSVDVSNEAIQKATDITGNNGIDVTSKDVNGVKTYKVSAKLSDNLLVNDAGNIDLASVLHVGSKITVDGNKGEITGLTNKTLNVEGFATQGRAATEEQLSAMQNRLTTDDKYVISGTIDKTKGTMNLNVANMSTPVSISGLTDYQVTQNGSSYDAENHRLTLNLKDTMNASNPAQSVTFDGIASTTDVAKATTEVKGGTNIASVVKTDGANGNAVYTVNAKGTTVSTDNNFVLDTTAAGNNVTNYGLSLADSITIGKGESSHPIVIDGNKGEITGLTNKTLNVEGFATKGRAATEEQLSAMQSGLTAADKYVTSGTIDKTNGTMKLTVANVSTPVSITGLTDYQVTQDGSSYDAKNHRLTLNLKDTMNTSNPAQSVTFDGIASTTDVAKATTEVKGGTNIASVVKTDGANGNAVYTVNAKGTMVSTDDNFVLATTAAENNVINYGLSLANSITIGKGESSHPIVIDGNKGEIKGLTNTGLNATDFAKVGRAATEEQLSAMQSGLTAADKYVTSGTIDKANGTMKLTVANVSTPVSISGLTDYQVTQNGSSYDAENHRLTLNLKDTMNASNPAQSVTFDGIASTTDVAKATTEVKGGTNIASVVKTDGANGNAVYTVNAKGTTVSTDNNFVLDTTAAGNNVTNYGLSLADSITIGKGESSHPIVIDGNKGEITGLTNKTLDVEGFATKGRAATEEQLKAVDEKAAKAASAKTIVAKGKNMEVTKNDNGDGSSTYTVGLADDVSLGNNAIQLKGTDGSISAKSGGAQLAFNNSGLTVSQAKNGLTNETRIDGATITVDGGAGNQTIINGSTARIGSVLVNGGSGTATISGLTNQTTNYTGFANGSGRAATEEQLKEVAGKAGEAVETAGKGWNLTTNKGTATNIKPDGTVDFSSSNDNLVISNAGANLSFSLSDNLDLTNNKDKKGSVKVGENTALTDELLQVGKDVSLTASALNVGNSSLTTSALMVGGLTYINSSGINANGRVISNVAAGIADTDAVNVGQLKSAISGSQVSIKAGDGISVNKAGNQYTINVNIEGLSNEHGTVHVSTDSDPSVVSKSTLTESETITPAPAKRMNSLLLAEEAVAAEPENGSSTGKKMYVKYTSNAVKLITDDITDPTKVAELNDGEEIFFSGDGNITTTTEPATDGKNTETIRFSLNKDVKVDSIEAKSGNQINIKSEVNMKSQKITNLADGEIAEGSKDAVNGGQIYNLKQNVSTNTENINILNEAVVANAENINSLSHSLNKLDSRINRVGAGAAALAALHPLDFDPDNKWDFAAGYGNYAGANAVAIGTYYRPNENTMFSIGGSFGGGENMINAGVSFKLGSGGSGITTSKTVMAKKIKEQDELLKAQDAKMKEQDEKIAKLEALVAQQGEMIQQALGKK